MEPILDVDGKRYLVLKSFHESRMPRPDFLEGIHHIRRSDGMIFVTEEIKDAEFEMLPEYDFTGGERGKYIKGETNDNSPSPEAKE